MKKKNNLRRDKIKIKYIQYMILFSDIRFNYVLMSKFWRDESEAFDYFQLVLTDWKKNYKFNNIRKKAKSISCVLYGQKKSGSWKEIDWVFPQLSL
jgi:hypothetical protein